MDRKLLERAQEARDQLIREDPMLNELIQRFTLTLLSGRDVVHETSGLTEWQTKSLYLYFRKQGFYTMIDAHSNLRIEVY